MRIAIECLGLLGFATNVWANLLIARKSETGWIVRLFANVLWLVYGLWIFSVANILSSIVFGGINIYGLRRWRRERATTPLEVQVKQWFELYDSPYEFNGDWPTFNAFHEHDHALRERVSAAPCAVCAREGVA